MDLSNIGNLFTLPFIIFCVVIYLTTRVFRAIIEFVAGKIYKVNIFILKALKKIKPLSQKIDIKHIDSVASWVWKENVLPATPILVGGLMAYLIKDYPYPDAFGTTVSSRVFLGLFAGLICTALYPRFNYYFKKYINKKADDLESKINSVEE